VRHRGEGGCPKGRPPPPSAAARFYRSKGYLYFNQPVGVTTEDGTTKVRPAAAHIVELAPPWWLGGGVCGLGPVGGGAWWVA